ncbi:NUDIX hydrolase [Pseudomonas putida S11]|nr:NUDIX hydrolase [Pseudomonas putida S11]
MTYQRVCFAARPVRHHADLALDSDIVRAVWLTRDELLAEPRPLAQRTGATLPRRLPQKAPCTASTCCATDAPPQV